MSYLSIVSMAGSQSLISRVAAAAADEGLVDPQPIAWAQANIWAIVSADAAWDAAWTFAVDNLTADDNPDTGMRPGVINDSMILAVVQPMVQQLMGTTP